MRDRVSSDLERNPDDKMIFGVSSGLADYFGIDPVLVRVGFVVATFVTGGAIILIYLLLAVLMPVKGEGNRRSRYIGGQTNNPVGGPGVSSKNPDYDDLERPQYIYRRPEEASRRRKVIGIILIGFGALILAANLGAFDWFSFRTFWPVVLILLGLLLVMATLRGGRRND